MSKGEIGLFSMILLCFNGIVGSGLFLLPGQIAAICGNQAIFVYSIVALIVMSIGWCFCKCAEVFTRNGGSYLYAKEAFGDFIGFEIGIMRWVVGMIAWAALTVGFITALGALYPLVLEAPYKQILILGSIISLALLNSFGVQNVKQFSNIVTVAKILPLIGFILFGLIGLNHDHFQLNEPFVMSSFGSAALIVFYAFGGFDALPTAASVMKNPKKNIPIAMMTAILMTSALYLIVQSICIGILGDHLASSQTPIADVAGVLFGTWGRVLVSIAMLISIGGIIVVSSFITPRACQAMAEEGSFYPKFFEQNRFGSPYMAIFVSAGLTALMALSGSFIELITISVVARFAQYITTCLSVFVFSKRGIMNPFDRPWKVMIPLFALLGIGWLIMQAEFYQLIWGFGALLLGIPLYFLQKKKAASLEIDVN